MRRFVVVLGLALSLLATSAVAHAGTGEPRPPSPVGPLGLPPTLPMPKDQPHPSQDDFYTPPDPLPAGKPGTVLKVRPVVAKAMPLLPLPVHAWQIMYLSTSATGKPVPVTGTVMVPFLPWVKGGPRPLVTFAIGTHGLADHCAPSFLIRAGLDWETPLFDQALLRGWAVVVTDYEGLGVNTLPHAFGIGQATARNQLDAARAALQVREAGLDRTAPVAAWGFSQGGETTVTAGSLIPTYAPELNWKGIAAGGMSPDFSSLFHAVGGPMSGLGLFGVHSFINVYPDVKAAVQKLLTPKGREVLDKLGGHCIVDALPQFAMTAFEALMHLPTPFKDLPAVKKRVAENSSGNHPAPKVPALLYHGTKDEVVPYEEAATLAKRWCSEGTPLTWRPLPGMGHPGAMYAGPLAAIPWLEQAFSGKAQESNCHQIEV